VAEEADLQAVVRAAIHPAIGIARVGNSEHGFFIGPEVADPPPAAPGFYRDDTGALKRQAAVFRIYGLNASGEAVAELTAAEAEITWTVHLANKKAAWYEFQLAQDIPEAAAAPPQFLRNLTVSDRASLVIDPGPRSIAGAGQHGAGYRFDTGRFMGTDVYLGELRTDAAGRLVVLGGHGLAASANGSRAVTFANNDGWHDDTSDGPVTAQVRLQGRTLVVDPAWVVVAPPNYAPDQKSVQTMWDLMRDVAIAAKLLAKPARPSFRDDIAPIFRRLTALQWVNAGFAAAFGWRAPNQLGSDAWLARLGAPDDADRHLRRAIVDQFRVPQRDGTSPVPWPYLYGDAMSTQTRDTPNAFCTLSTTQMTFLHQWADGEFDADFSPGVVPLCSIDAVPIAEQPAMLDRAALEFCLADAFHPGCEMTWPMRIASLYMAPFRILHAPPGWIEPDYSAQYQTGQTSGPIFQGQVPGGVTRWMAVPWQTDTASCRGAYGARSGYSYGPYLPTFWPARVPNEVLTTADYAIVMDAERPTEQRHEALQRRAAWTRPITHSTNYVDQINAFLRDIAQMGVVETRPGPGHGFPASLGVEDVAPAPPAGVAPTTARHGHAGGDDLDDIAKVHRFPNGLGRRV
jgi:hypothetical protein